MAQLPPDDMKPIADAPTDGTRIEVWRPGYGLYSVQWKDGTWTVREGKTVPAHEVTLWRHPPPPNPTPVVEREPDEYDPWGIEHAGEEGEE